MPGTGLPPLLRHLLRAGRSAAVACALVALLGLTGAPHDHGSAGEERSCPACQVSRLDGSGLPEPGSLEFAAPAGAEPPSLVVSVDRLPRRAPAAPLPSRGPPPVSLSEPS
jgi:hypothetical protein